MACHGAVLGMSVLPGLEEALAQGSQGAQAGGSLGTTAPFSGPQRQG